MILYGSSLSPFVRKVLAYAGEKGIELAKGTMDLRVRADDARRMGEVLVG